MLSNVPQGTSMLYIISLLLYEKDKLDSSVALHNIKHLLYQGYKSLHCLLQTCVLICLYMYGMYFVLWDTTLMCEKKVETVSDKFQYGNCLKIQGPCMSTF